MSANTESGVVTVNRQVLSQNLLNTILPAVQQFCNTTNVHVNVRNPFGEWSANFDVVPNQTPQTSTVTDVNTGAQIINITYTSQNDGGVSDSDSDMGFTVRLNIVPNYTCQVSVTGTTMTVVQRLWVSIFLNCGFTTVSINGYDTTLTDVYDVSVDQSGDLQLSLDQDKETSVDNSQTADNSWMESIIVGVNGLVGELKQAISPLSPLDMGSLNLSIPQNSVSPCPNVLTYGSATFSENQDLVCDISYANKA
jgi:hypothetical protein